LEPSVSTTDTKHNIEPPYHGIANLTVMDDTVERKLLSSKWNDSHIGYIVAGCQKNNDVFLHWQHREKCPEVIKTYNNRCANLILCNKAGNT
jgi:hypothetical protein